MEVKIEFTEIHPYIHSYKVKGLNDFLNKHKEEIDSIYYSYKEKRKEGRYNTPINNPNIHQPLTNLLLQITNQFYIVDKSLELAYFSLYSQTNQDNISCFHQHYNDANIVSTMYLNPHLLENGGGLQFDFGENEEPIVYPQKDTIYFFPGWVLHRPLSHVGNKIRHCINWGYDSNKRPIHKLTGSKW